MRRSASVLLCAGIAFTSLIWSPVAARAEDTPPYVVTTISAGNLPRDMATSPTGDFVYMANYTGGSVSVIDTASDTLVAVLVAGGKRAEGVAVSPDGAKLYVADSMERKLFVIPTANIDLTTLAPQNVPGTQSFSVSYGASDVAVTPDGKKVFVANTNIGTVSVLDTLGGSVSAFDIGGYPETLLASPAGDRLYARLDDPSLLAVRNVSDHAQAMAPVTLPDNTSNTGLRGAVLAPDGTRVYVCDTPNNAVLIVNTSDGSVDATSISVGNRPKSIAVTHDGKTLFVGNNFESSVSVIDTDTKTVTKTLTVGFSPGAVALNRDGTKAYVGHNSGVSVIATGYVPPPPSKPSNPRKAPAMVVDQSVWDASQQISAGGQAANLSAGSAVTFRLGVRSSGTATLRSVSLSDDIPEGMSVVPGSTFCISSGLACAVGVTGRTLTADLGDLAVGETALVSFEAVVDAWRGEPGLRSYENFAHFGAQGLSADTNHVVLSAGVRPGAAPEQSGSDGLGRGVVASTGEPGAASLLLTLGMWGLIATGTLMLKDFTPHNLRLLVMALPLVIVYVWIRALVAVWNFSIAWLPSKR